MWKRSNRSSSRNDKSTNRTRFLDLDTWRDILTSHHTSSKHAIEDPDDSDHEEPTRGRKTKRGFPFLHRQRTLENPNSDAVQRLINSVNRSFLAHSLSGDLVIAYPSVSRSNSGTSFGSSTDSKPSPSSSRTSVCESGSSQSDGRQPVATQLEQARHSGPSGLDPPPIGSSVQESVTGKSNVPAHIDSTPAGPGIPYDLYEGVGIRDFAILDDTPSVGHELSRHPSVGADQRPSIRPRTASIGSSTSSISTESRDDLGNQDDTKAAERGFYLQPASSFSTVQLVSRSPLDALASEALLQAAQHRYADATRQLKDRSYPTLLESIPEDPRPKPNQADSDTWSLGTYCSTVADGPETPYEPTEATRPPTATHPAMSDTINGARRLQPPFQIFRPMDESGTAIRPYNMMTPLHKDADSEKHPSLFAHTPPDSIPGQQPAYSIFTDKNDADEDSLRALHPSPTHPIVSDHSMSTEDQPGYVIRGSTHIERTWPLGARTEKSPAEVDFSMPFSEDFAAAFNMFDRVAASYQSDIDSAFGADGQHEPMNPHGSLPGKVPRFQLKREQAGRKMSRWFLD